MRYTRTLTSLVALLAVGGCATAPQWGLPAVTVTALAESEPVGTAEEDAADDPAIWHNAADPAASLIVATDKKAGLYVYGLDGSTRHFAPGGLLNNVDLVDLGTAGIIVVASDRGNFEQAELKLYRLDPVSARLINLGSVPGGEGEAYGLCLWQNGAALHAFSVLKSGLIEEYRIELGSAPMSVPVLSRRVPSQPEGCVVDPRNGDFYVGEENAGIWRFAAGSAAGTLVAPTDGQQLVADVEGLALAPEGADGGWLIASSQGDNAYARYRLPDMEPAGRFRIAAGAFGSTEETDGIELSTKPFGPKYPGGLFVAQDGVNAPSAQNFKLVSWADIEAALAGTAALD